MRRPVAEPRPVPAVTLSIHTNLSCPPGVAAEIPSWPSGVTDCDPHVLLLWSQSVRPRKQGDRQPELAGGGVR